MKHPDISIEEYHRPGKGKFISHSGLRDFNIGPRRYMGKHIAGNVTFEPSDVMIVGQAFEDYLMHVLGYMTLEEVEEKYAIRPLKLNGTTKDGKITLANLKASGKPIIKREFFKKFEHMVASIESMTGMMETLQQAEAQVSYRVPFPGLPGIQSRPDFSLPENGFMGRAHIDLKTIESLDMIDKSMWEHGYFSQAAMVANTTDVDEYHCLFVEKSGTNRAQLVKVSQGYIDVGTQWCMRQLGGLVECYRQAEEDDTWEWPRMVKEHRTIEPPPWLIEREMRLSA